MVKNYMGFMSFMTQVWTLSARLKETAERVAEMDTACQNMTANYDKVGGSSGSGGGSCDGAAAALADMRSKLDECRLKLVHAEAELTRFCKTLEERDGLVLKYRYVLRLEWPQILDVMTRQGYECCQRTLFRWHDQARRNARMIWEEQHAQYEGLVRQGHDADPGAG